MKESIWEGEIRKNAHQKAVGPCNRIERRVCAKKGKGVFAVERGKREGTSIHGGSTAKRIYLAIKITTDLTSLFCSKEEWKKENGTRLSLCKSVDNKK